MTWLLRTLYGPALWAFVFSLVYALHGIGCAQGWPGVATPLGSLHLLAMAAAWVAGLGASLGLILWLPKGQELPQRLPRAGAWIGLGATFLTLLPIGAATSC